MELEELLKNEGPPVREAIEEERYTIWPSDTAPGIDRFVFSINRDARKVDMEAYYDRTVAGAFKFERVLNKRELEALEAQIRRLQMICKDRYGAK